ncbi:hypothetical protein HYU50_02835 [Candidatus Woesearchaeota archaeon]|nr:hypothetical protein [Candidatus Woesearchaeota archaeon]
MRKELSVFFIALLFFSSAFAVLAAQKTYRPAKIYDIAVTLVNQEPDPAEPGKYVDVRFKFDNNGTGEARNVIVELLPEYPFSLDTGVNAIRNLGTIQSMQRGDVGVIVKYRLRVDENAVEGENDLKIRYKIEGYSWIEPEEFKVDVQTHDAVLSVNSVSIGEKILQPGASNTVKIMVSNEADSALKDIKARLELGGLPFIPLGSTNEKSIYKIDSMESYEFDFEILANPEAASGAYQVPLKITYSDELGKPYSKNSTIGLIVGARPDISVTLDATEVYETKKPGEIVIKVVNKGVTDIKFANVKLMPSKDYRILSNDEDYLGNIDSDDYETAEFKIYVENKKDKKVILPISIEYMDANNNEYKTDMNIEMPLYSASEAKKLGLAAGNGKIGFFIVVLIVAAGLFAYRRWKRSRKK